MSNYAHTERSALADLFDEVGPDAPTLCGTWTTADLAAHLVARERRPDGAIGILVAPFSRHAERVRLGIRNGRRWPDLVETVRSGPPLPLRPLDATINTVEYFVHHEDVRRVPGIDWHPRSLDPAEEAILWSRLGLMGRFLWRGSPVGVDLVSANHGQTQAKKGDDTVTLSGPPSELLLFAFGRQAQARVGLEGDKVSVERLTSASLGL